MEKIKVKRFIELDVVGGEYLPINDLIVKLVDIRGWYLENGFDDIKLAILREYEGFAVMLSGNQLETDEEFEVRRKAYYAEKERKALLTHKKELEERKLYQKLKEKYDKQ